MTSIKEELAELDNGQVIRAAVDYIAYLEGQVDALSDPPVICATLGCKREATTHAKFDGLNTMLCEECDKGQRFLRENAGVPDWQGMYQKCREREIAKRSIHLMPASVTMVDKSTENSVFPAEDINPGAGRLDDSFKDESINGQQLYQHDICGNQTALSADFARAVENGVASHIYCETCKRHFSANNFTPLVDADFAEVE